MPGGGDRRRWKRLKEKVCEGERLKRIAGMVERSHGAVTKALHFHQGTSSDVFSLMVYLWFSQ